jgi:S1-C subfamily serine protease
MKSILSVMVVIATLPAFAPAQAPSLDDLFTRQPHRRRRAEQGARRRRRGITRFTETGSGVLVSSDGKVMTAAHVVNGMDEITVEGIGGEVVRATIVSANAAADVSLLQLERVTKAMRVAGNW